MWLKKETILAVAGTAFTAVIMVPPFLGQSGGTPQARMGLQKPPAVNVASPLPAGAMANAATTACTECHEARIILQQRLSKAAWTKEVDKMMKWGAVVNPADHDALIDYLSTNFSPDQPPYVPPRSSTERQAAKAK